MAIKCPLNAHKYPVHHLKKLVVSTIAITMTFSMERERMPLMMTTVTILVTSSSGISHATVDQISKGNEALSCRTIAVNSRMTNVKNFLCTAVMKSTMSVNVVMIFMFVTMVRSPMFMTMMSFRSISLPISVYFSVSISIRFVYAISAFFIATVLSPPYNDIFIPWILFYPACTRQVEFSEVFENWKKVTDLVIVQELSDGGSVAFYVFMIVVPIVAEPLSITGSIIMSTSVFFLSFYIIKT